MTPSAPPTGGTATAGREVGIPLFGPNLSAHLLDGLAGPGWAYVPHALDPDLTAALRAELLMRDAAGDLDEAGIGRGETYLRRRDIRRTRIFWLDGTTPAQAQFLAGCDAFRRQMNEVLFAGLHGFEAHFAVYPPGGHYARHLDAFAHPARPAGPAPIAGIAAPRTRVVSLVVYLNAAWDEADGGELVLWTGAPVGAGGRPDLAALDSVPPACMIVPHGGGVVTMLSETIPHEVRPTRVPRYGIAGWWRIRPDTVDLLA